MWALKNKAAIAGIGYTEFSKNSGVSTLTLGLRAVLAALDDAGLPLDKVDGLATHRTGDSAVPGTLAHSLGLTDLAWQLDLFGGGSASHSVVGQAALAVCSGIADYVVCYRALNARSEFRMGGTGRPPVDVAETQYQAPYGYFTPPQQFAMLTREHMLRYGTTHEQSQCSSAPAPSTIRARSCAMRSRSTTISRRAGSPSRCDSSTAASRATEPLRS
jgi:acetyl-CoA acetyltransferase